MSTRSRREYTPAYGRSEYRLGAIKTQSPVVLCGEEDKSSQAPGIGLGSRASRALDTDFGRQCAS